jgi:hypothetical protein
MRTQPPLTSQASAHPAAAPRNPFFGGLVCQAGDLDTLAAPPRDGEESGKNASRNWTGTPEGFISMLIILAGALLFGGAAGNWFAAGDAGLFQQLLKISVVTAGMGVAVSLLGTFLAGKNAILRGMTMPILVYVTGTLFALFAGKAGSLLLLAGAPVFCGFAIATGVLTAYLAERGDG